MQDAGQRRYFKALIRPLPMTAAPRTPAFAWPRPCKQQRRGLVYGAGGILVAQASQGATPRNRGIFSADSRATLTWVIEIAAGSA